MENENRDREADIGSRQPPVPVFISDSTFSTSRLVDLDEVPAGVLEDGLGAVFRGRRFLAEDDAARFQELVFLLDILDTEDDYREASLVDATLESGSP